jgi:hypothetical protein
MQLVRIASMSSSPGRVATPQDEQAPRPATLQPPPEVRVTSLSGRPGLAGVFNRQCARRPARLAIAVDAALE